MGFSTKMEMEMDSISISVSVSVSKIPISLGDGRCEDCLRKLVFMTRCEAYECGRWVCEHHIVQRTVPITLEEEVDTNSEGHDEILTPTQVQVNFCSKDCSFSDTDSYLIRLRHVLKGKL